MINGVLGFITSFKSAAINLLDGLDTKSDSILSAVEAMTTVPPPMLSGLAYSEPATDIEVLGSGYLVWWKIATNLAAAQNQKIYLDGDDSINLRNDVAWFTMGIYPCNLRFENKIKFDFHTTTVMLCYTLD